MPQQALPLVKPDRMNAEPRLPRQFANVQRTRHYRLPPSPISMMHPRHDSRFKNFFAFRMGPDFLDHEPGSDAARLRAQPSRVVALDSFTSCPGPSLCPAGTVCHWTNHPAPVNYHRFSPPFISYYPLTTVNLGESAQLPAPTTNLVLPARPAHVPSVVLLEYDFWHRTPPILACYTWSRERHLHALGSPF